MEDIKVDLTKMPESAKYDAIQRAVWVQEEKNKIINERTNKQPATNNEENKEVKTEQQTDEPVSFKLEDFKDIGEYKTVDEIKAALKEGGLTKKERDALKQELEEAKQNFAEQKPINTFFDKDLKRLDILKKDKPEDFELYTRLKFGVNDPFEIVKLKFMREHPEYKNRVEDAEMYLKDLYGVDHDYDKDDPDDVKEMKINKMKLELEADNAKKQFLSEFEKIDVPEPTIVDGEKVSNDNAEKVKKAKQEAKKHWQPIATEIAKRFDEFPVMTKGKEGSDSELMRYKIPEEYKNELAGKVVEYLVESGKPFTEDSVREAQSYIQTVFLVEHWSSIISEAVSHARSITNEEWHKTYNNPSSLTSKNSPTEKDTFKTKNNEERQKALRHLGVIK